MIFIRGIAALLFVIGASVALVAAYGAPSLIARYRHAPGIGQVVVVNLLLGWTIIGWIAALVMAFRPARRGPAHD